MDSFPDDFTGVPGSSMQVMPLGFAAGLAAGLSGDLSVDFVCSAEQPELNVIKQPNAKYRPDFEYFRGELSN